MSITKVAPGCVVYNVATEGDLVVDAPGSVLTTALLPDTTSAGGGSGGDGKVVGVPMRSEVGLDGGAAWKDAVLGNAWSFEQVYAFNADADVAAMEMHAMQLHAAAAATL